MADEGEYLPEPHAGPGGSAAKWILLLLGVLYVAGSLYFLFNLRERIDQLDKTQTASSTQLTTPKRICALDTRLTLCCSVRQPPHRIQAGPAVQDFVDGNDS